MICLANLILPPSGDYAQAGVLRTDGGNGAPANLTGWTTSIVDVTGVLGGAVAVSLTDAANGAFLLTVVWQGAWPVVPALLGSFRLRVTDGSDEMVTEPVQVYVAGPALTLTVARGSDMDYAFTWPDDRAGASLAGEVLDVVGASATLGPLVSVAVTDAATRACALHIEGDLAVALGDAGSFQLRRRLGGLTAPRTLLPIKVIFA